MNTTHGTSDKHICRHRRNGTYCANKPLLERAYEKVIKENILCILEDSQRDQKEAKALYLEKYPLDRAYQDWLKSDVSGTAMLRYSIDDTAKDVVKERREKQRESR